MAFFEDVWSRNFLNIFATPLTSPNTSAAWCSPASAPACSGLAVMLALSTPVFGLRSSRSAYGCVPYLLVLFLFGIALGIIAAGMVLRLRPGVGMAGVADPGAALAVRRRVLSAVHAAGVDAGRGERAAAVATCSRACARWLAGGPHDARPLLIGWRIALLQILLAGGDSAGSTATRCAPGCWRDTARRARAEPRPASRRRLRRHNRTAQYWKRCPSRPTPRWPANGSGCSGKPS